jgi:hypothetical protein
VECVDVTVGVVRPEVICILRMMVYVSFVVGILIQIQLVIVVLVGVAGTADVVIVQNVTNLLIIIDDILYQKKF